MIELTKEIDVQRPPDLVFAFIDAEDKAPHWLSRCVEITRTSPGAKAVGSTLRYTYQQGGRKGTMDGVVTEYEPGKRLGMKYTDRMFDISIGFDVAATSTGAHVTERVAIEPKGIVGKLMSPLIGLATRRQTGKDMETLKHLLERPG